MKTKILSSIIIAMVAVFALSMTPKKVKGTVKKLPVFTCPYPIRNFKSCKITISYEFVDAANNFVCGATNVTVPAGSPGVITLPCCAGAANVYVVVTSIGGSTVFQTPASVSGPAGFGNIQNAGGTCSTSCGGTFNVQWTPNGTNVN